jgi:hypothetical protein
MWQRWRTRSRRAAAMTSSPKTSCGLARSYILRLTGSPQVRQHEVVLNHGVETGTPEKKVLGASNEG